MSFSCSRKEKIALYLFRQLSVMTMLRGQSTCSEVPLSTCSLGHASPIHPGQDPADLVPELQAAQHIRSIRGKHFRQVLEGKGQVGSMGGVPMEAILQCLAQDAVKDQWVEQLSRRLPSP